MNDATRVVINNDVGCVIFAIPSDYARLEQDIGCPKVKGKYFNRIFYGKILF